MAKVRVKLNREGVKELLQSPEMARLLKGHADRAVGRLGDGYEASVYTGKSRVNASVKAVTFEARKENAKTNSILKAILS